MRVLFVVPYVPDRIRTRPYHLIRGLAALGHDVTVATVWTTSWERTALAGLRSELPEVHATRLPRARSLWNSAITLPSRTPLQAVYCWEPGLPAILEGLLARSNGRPAFDVIHVEHLRGARYGLWLKGWMNRHQTRIPILWDSVDCISLLFRQSARRSRSTFGRWIGRIELGRTERFEARMLREFDGVIATSALDAKALQLLDGPAGGARPVRVITVGVDLEYFSPADDGRRASNQLVMTGKMSYHANVTMAVDFVKGILPKVLARVPEAHLKIVGKDPSRDVMALHHPPEVEVVGTVPDVRPYLREAAVAVAPLPYGAGVQSKVLEAMACSTPVVLSTVAARGIRLEPERDALVAEGEEEFAGAVARLLGDPELRAQIGRAGRRYVEQHHDWLKIARQLEGVYDEIVRSGN
jgi:sugar transferase (PEP-CTERM/EpsH1 system associated)